MSIIPFSFPGKPLEPKPAAVNLIFALLVALSPVLPQEKSILLEGPADVKEGDLQLAAKTLEARCAAFGYKGIKCAVVDLDSKKAVELSCELGITDRMLPRIKELVRRSCKEVAIRFERYLNAREREQYEPGKTAPEGAEWIKVKDDMILVEKLPNASVAGAFTLKSKGPGRGPCATLSKTVFEPRKPTDLESAVLIVDGERIRGVELTPDLIYDTSDPKAPAINLTTRARDAEDEILSVSLALPMPVAFKLPK